ncbi:hypothetical protein DFH06DRAFT_1320174 [Mycena polygramma]|nr:hypothetical protein DFH06DRAFT_1320174 [Mycena polygramma]
MWMVEDRTWNIFLLSIALSTPRVHDVSGGVFDPNGPTVQRRTSLDLGSIAWHCAWMHLTHDIVQRQLSMKIADEGKTWAVDPPQALPFHNASASEAMREFGRKCPAVTKVLKLCRAGVPSITLKTLTSNIPGGLPCWINAFIYVSTKTAFTEARFQGGIVMWDKRRAQRVRGFRSLRSRITRPRKIFAPRLGKTLGWRRMRALVRVTTYIQAFGSAAHRTILSSNVLILEIYDCT